MTPDRAGGGEVPTPGCAAAEEAMERDCDAVLEAAPADDGWAVCLFACGPAAAAAAALAVRDDGACGRKAAKNVERKKGRCDGIVDGM